MKPTPLFDYFFFGTCVRYLEDIRTGYRIHTTDEGMYVLGNLSAFYSYLNELNLQVTYRASGNLLPLLEELGESDKDARLTEDQAQKLSSAMHEVRCTLEAELKGFEIYVVTPKRIDTVRLLHDISALFAPAVFEKLPEIARYDLILQRDFI
jgi:hypothetical protein